MSPEDQETIHRIRAGETEAYADLVRRYQVRIRSYCLWVLRNATEAEDAAQEVFIKAYRSLGGFRGEASFSTWLHRIAVNHCRDLIRRAARERTESWDALREREGEAAEGRVRSVEPAAMRRDQLRQALAQLPEQSREILILREVQGLSYQELAEFLRCSPDAVKARLRRARSQLEEKVPEALRPG